MTTPRIDLTTIDRESFDLDETPLGILITPKRGKVNYRPDELGLRSVLCAPDGCVLSRGLPKFFNHGENAEHDAETRRLLAARAKVVYTEKLDGTLIIRSVIDGKVHLRTRGNHSLGDFEAPVMALVRERYPLILETGARGSLGWSHVFEYTAPTNRIVVAYDEAKLTALGCVEHATGAFEPHQDTWFDVALVKRRDLDADPDTAAKEAAEMTGDEGVVAWIERPDGACHLVKMKSLWWLRAHALASFATYDRIREFVFAHNLTATWQFVAALQAAGVDYEIASQHVGLFEQVIDDWARRMRELVEALVRVEDIRALPDSKSKA